MITGKQFGLSLLLTAVLIAGGSEAARESRISATKHNLSSSGTGTTHSTTESQMCVFCHTPHNADTSQTSPLWNKTLADTSGNYYAPYTSSSFDAAAIQGASAGQPLGASKLCLSCHDGVMAIGSVRVLNGASTTIGGGTQVTMPAGASGATSGYTRLIGTNLENDHPISVTYDQALAERDGELRPPTASPQNQWGNTFGRRTAGTPYKPLLPLQPTGAASAGQVQCTTCHDPHMRDNDTSQATGTKEGNNIKFLRGLRFQKNQPINTATTYTANSDIVCLACHDKGGDSWAYSAHANEKVATHTYKTAAATTRDFPKAGDPGITTDLPVWRAACLNCHDTHTVAGARRLLREGTNSTASPKTGGTSAIEETCFQCHTTTTNKIVDDAGGTIPDIYTDLTTVGNKRMPVTASTEVHDIGGSFNNATFVDCSTINNKCGKDFIESRQLLGLGDLAKRHTECTDCHNPHRVVKFKDFRGNPAGTLSGNPDASGTHKHTDDATDIHTNIASGVLRGAWGVEPTYTNSAAGRSFHALPSGYSVKRGDPGNSTTAVVGDGYVTREYQICLKCHSDYAYSDDNIYPNSANRPQLGGTGLTAQNANGHSNFTSYTNQAKEFQAPSTHAVAVGSVNLGAEAGNAKAGSTNNNHRSWHPVLQPTGRTGRTGAWLAPWNNSGTGGKAGRLGVQTMYCSDCHGSSTGTVKSVIPTNGENGNAWGPHGSSINFLLKGDYSTGSGEGVAGTLCFKCHDQGKYATAGASPTGWKTNDGEANGDGHGLHANRVGSALRCNWCHVAVPHGWKNRNLLVNLLDVGEEAGLAAGSAPAYTKNTGYTNGPYYRKAFLRVISFPAAGTNWSVANCNGGSKDGMINTCQSPN